MQMENRGRTAVSTQHSAKQKTFRCYADFPPQGGILGVVRSPMKSIRIARPISGRRKNPAAKAGFLEHLYGPAEARALIRT
jgi:hypothetical protein